MNEEAIAQAKQMLGIDIDAILESRIAKALSKVLVDSKFGEIVPAMQAKMEMTDKELAELKQILTSFVEQIKAGQAVQPANGGGLGDIANLIALVKGGGGGSGNSFDGFMESMMKFQTLSAQMWQNPLAQATKMVLDMQAGSYKLGASREEIKKGTETLLEGLNPKT